jgi:hypothetical protein
MHARGAGGSSSSKQALRRGSLEGPLLAVLAVGLALVVARR